MKRYAIGIDLGGTKIMIALVNKETGEVLGSVKKKTKKDKGPKNIIRKMIEGIEELMEEKVQFVLLGTGDGCYEQIFASLCERYGDKARALLRFDRALSKEIYAAADIFLMPSKTEPCGLAQMIACRYGTVPVVHGVGGLADSIVPYGEEGSLGFVFRNFNAHDMLFRLKDALALYEDREAWDALTVRAATADFTWKTSAEDYIRLYKTKN